VGVYDLSEILRGSLSSLRAAAGGAPAFGLLLLLPLPRALAAPPLPRFCGCRPGVNVEEEEEGDDGDDDGGMKSAGRGLLLPSPPPSDCIISGSQS